MSAKTAQMHRQMLKALILQLIVQPIKKCFFFQFSHFLGTLLYAVCPLHVARLFCDDGNRSSFFVQVIVRSGFAAFSNEYFDDGSIMGALKDRNEYLRFCTLGPTVMNAINWPTICLADASNSAIA